MPSRSANSLETQLSEPPPTVEKPEETEETKKLAESSGEAASSVLGSHARSLVVTLIQWHVRKHVERSLSSFDAPARRLARVNRLERFLGRRPENPPRRSIDARFAAAADHLQRVKTTSRVVEPTSRDTDRRTKSTLPRSLLKRLSQSSQRQPWRRSADQPRGGPRKESPFRISGAGGSAPLGRS